MIVFIFWFDVDTLLLYNELYTAVKVVTEFDIPSADIFARYDLWPRWRSGRFAFTHSNLYAETPSPSLIDDPNIEIFVIFVIIIKRSSYKLYYKTKRLTCVLNCNFLEVELYRCITSPPLNLTKLHFT